MPSAARSVFKAQPTPMQTPPPVTAPAPKPAASPAPTALLDQSKQYSDLASGSQIKAVTGTFDESKGVAGRVDDLTSKDGLLMQAARTRAAQEANSRGLRNSSMAVQAGEQAVIETATPIAQSDAQLYQNQSLKNQDAQNQTNQFNSNIKTNVGLAGADAQRNSTQFNQNLLEQARQFDSGAQLDRAKLKEQSRQFDSEQDYKAAELQMRQTIAQMDASSRENLAQIEAGYKTEIESNRNIANAWGTLMDNISQIQNNPELGADAKKKLIDNQIASFQSFTNFWKKVSGGAVDVSDLLDFGSLSGPDGTQQPPPAPAPAPGGIVSNNPNHRPGDGSQS